MLLNQYGNIISDKEIKDRKIIVYGASTRNKAVIEKLGISNQIVCYVDSDVSKVGLELDGYKIESPEIIRSLHDCIVVSVLLKYADEVYSVVSSYGCNSCYFYQLEVFDIMKNVKRNADIMKIETNYSYIHFFPNDKFVVSFYKMVEKYFNINEHFFVVNYLFRGKDRYGLNEFIDEKNQYNHNIIVFDDVHYYFKSFDEPNCNSVFETEKMRIMCMNAQKIFLHSVFLGECGKRMLANWTGSFGEKMAWIAWGGDTYYDGDSFVVKEILQKIGSAYTAKSRVGYIKENYKIDIKASKATYSFIPQSEVLHSQKDEKDGFNILLGHSAAEYGNHEYGLKVIHKFNEQNIKIFCPLSYGSEEYRNSVICLGKEMFGEKFVPMTEFMEMDQYYTFLQTIDVAVIPMVRHAAGTTIIYMNSLGKKIYVLEDMVKCYNQLGIKLENISNIESMSFQEFINVDKQSKEMILNSIDILNQDVVQKWNKIFKDGVDDEYDTI